MNELIIRVLCFVFIVIITIIIIIIPITCITILLLFLFQINKQWIYHNYLYKITRLFQASPLSISRKTYTQIRFRNIGTRSEKWSRTDDNPQTGDFLAPQIAIPHLNIKGTRFAVKTRMTAGGPTVQVGSAPVIPLRTHWVARRENRFILLFSPWSILCKIHLHVAASAVVVQLGSPAKRITGFTGTTASTLCSDGPESLHDAAIPFNGIISESP